MRNNKYYRKSGNLFPLCLSQQLPLFMTWCWDTSSLAADAISNSGPRVFSKFPVLPDKSGST